MVRNRLGQPNLQIADTKKAWKRVLERAEINDLRIHDIRRTLGSYQAIAGASLSVIGKSQGHKSQRATEVYRPPAPRPGPRLD